MKQLIPIFLIAFFLFSCSHGIENNRIENHYAFIERVVDKPELLDEIVKDSTLIFWHKESKAYSQKFDDLNIRLLKEHIKKYFENGYIISRDEEKYFIDLPYEKKYKAHEIALKSKSADKVLYFDIIKDKDGLWKIESINDFDPYIYMLKRMGK